MGESAARRSSQSRSFFRRRVLTGILVITGVVYCLLVLPYARALWWLHYHRTPPRTCTLPVRGVEATELEQSFGAPRAGGPHEGIDILAPAGTPVLAAADGVVIGNRATAIGGNNLWVLGSGRRLYYYAHMRKLAPRLHLGKFVAAGQQIGSVGNTGNAMTTPPHLHFSVYEVTSDFYPLRYVAIDPYRLMLDSSP